MARPSYSPVQRPWTWDNGTASERADMIRHHAELRGMKTDGLCRLFQITPDGLLAILNGHTWSEDFALPDNDRNTP
ncbi:MAG: hypothetical protein JWQ94_3734 [Tardiphaga sp.]|nr:hypothetical protein [Tardiphaga sp.]